MSATSKKKLKMERLSPIPAPERSHPLSDALHTPDTQQHTPVRLGVASSHRRQKDAYAIEITSSPEFGQLPVATGSSSLLKQRRIRNIARSRAPKKPNSTPLSGLITRKTVNVAAKDAPHSSDAFSSPTSADVPPPEGSPSDIHKGHPPIDEYSPRKPPCSPRHSEIISASAVFSRKPQPSTSHSTPLTGIFNKKASNMNRSLNDSILILREAEDPSDDEIAPNTSLCNLPIAEAEIGSIETFESPRKPHFALPKAHTSAASISKNFRPLCSKNLIIDNLNETSPVIEKSNSGEMCGNERKNRKRALDFNSTSFMVPIQSDDGGNLSIKYLDREPVGGQSPILKLKFPHSRRESDCLSTSRAVPRCERGDDQSQILDPTSLSYEREHDCQSPSLILKPTKSPVLTPMPLGRERESPPSPAIDILPLEHELEPDCQPPSRDFKFPCRGSDRRSPILIPTSSNDCKSPCLAPQSERGDEQSQLRNLTCLGDYEHDCRSSTFNPAKSPIVNPMLPGHPRENPQSPPIKVLPPGSDSPDYKPPLHDSGSRSPILIPLSPKHKKEHPKSPVLNVTPLGNDPEADRKSPILINRQSPIINLKAPQSPVLNLMSADVADFEPLTKFPENKPQVEKQDELCLSDADSVIESTLRQFNGKQDSVGFTASSCLFIENSPSSPGKVNSSDELDIPKIVELPEKTSTADEICDMRFVVVSHETSSNECVDDQVGGDSAVVFPIDGRHSPLQLNHTTRPIQSFESPSKAAKPFSEALNIGAFGSPDSNASDGGQEEEEDGDIGTDEIIEPSTSQEFIAESELLRPTKRRKKGSLLERVKGIIAKVNASNTLFDYEIKSGLRPSNAKFVSAPLVLLKKSGRRNSLFLVCKPLKYCKNSSHVDLSSFVIIHVNKLPSGACDGSVILLHFPLSVMFASSLHIPYVLAGHQIVLHPMEEKMDVETIDTSSLESINSISSAYTQPMTSFRTLPSTQLRTLSEAALGQTLVEESDLHLTVLHVTKFRAGAVTKTSVLCCDEESQFCWLEFSSERDIGRAAALETLRVLSDGSQVQTKGFVVTGRVRLDRKSRTLISYCSNSPVNNEITFSVQPKESNWVISSTDGPSEAKKVRSSVSNILSEKISGRRYLLEVHGVGKEQTLSLKDSQGQSIEFIIGENSNLTLDRPVPFILDGIYFFEGKLYSDEHTREISID